MCVKQNVHTSTPSVSESVSNCMAEGKADNVLRSMGLLQTETKSSCVRPSEEDYRALIYDLLLFRRESLEGFLAALRTERKLLESKIHHFELLINKYSQMREEIRTMLTTHSTVESEHANTTALNGQNNKGKYNSNTNIKANKQMLNEEAEQIARCFDKRKVAQFEQPQSSRQYYNRNRKRSLVDK